MPVCSYCGKNKKQSREHIYSKGLLLIFNGVAPKTIDRNRGNIHGGDPIVRDICEDCNNDLSICDSVIINFARKHLIQVPNAGDTIETSREEVERWITKTAANAFRSMGNGDHWWKQCIPFIKGKERSQLNADFYFSPWQDLSPSGVAISLNLVHTISASEALLVGFSAGSSAELCKQLDACIAIKLGSGVFLLTLWTKNSNLSTRQSVKGDLNSYGWRHIDNTITISRQAYNIGSTTTYNIIANPLRDIVELIAEEKSNQ